MPAGVLAPPFVARATAHADRSAIVDREGRYTYAQLLAASHAVATALLDGRADLAEACVPYLAPPGLDWVATQWGIWRAGGIAVPLALSHPEPELEYVIADARATTVVAHPDLVVITKSNL